MLSAKVEGAGVASATLEVLARAFDRTWAVALVARATGALGKAAHDLCRRFAEEIRREVRETVARAEDIEDELRHLIRLLQS